jgi:hypothetical protein
MLLYRAAVLGVLVALTLLIAQRSATWQATAYFVERAEVPRRVDDEAPTIVDLSLSSMRSAEMPVEIVLGLRPDERLMRVAHGAGYSCGMEQPLVTLRRLWKDLAAPGFLDVEVKAPNGRPRRILVLAHP